MKEIIKETATNGRSGLSVVSPEKPENLARPIRGELQFLGRFEGHETYQLTPSDTAEQWYLFGGDIKTIAGATAVTVVSLQSSKCASIIALGDFAVVEAFGYKGRSSSVLAFKEGERIKLPTSVMAAMGLIPTPAAESVKPEIPVIENNLAAALKAAGIN